MDLTFDWATERWSDPLTGTDVVRISPDRPLHFRNPYFRSTMFTRDGRWMALRADHPENGTPESMWIVDLRSGDAAPVNDCPGPAAFSHWGFSPSSNLLHVIDNTGELPAIIQVDVPSGSTRRIEPSEPVPSIAYGECTADERYIFAHESRKQIPPGTSHTDEIAMRGSEPGHNLMHRIDLSDGATDVVFETHDWWMGHCNPNPTNPDLFMCSQEGFIWTDRYPKPGNYQRQRIYDFARGTWLDLQGQMRSQGTHEHWSANGLRVYSHMPGGDLHALYVTDLDTETSTRYICPPDVGLSIHTAPAPDESFVIGDGFNFCSADAAEMAEHGDPGSGDNPWSWDGISQASPGETIWIYELPDQTLWSGELELQDNAAMRAAIAANPEGTVKTRPLCEFRSRAKLLRETIRLESNAHVTPDSQWGVFQSCNPEGLYEVWAARVERSDSHPLRPGS